MPSLPSVDGFEPWISKLAHTIPGREEIVFIHQSASLGKCTVPMVSLGAATKLPSWQIWNQKKKPQLNWYMANNCCLARYYA